VRPLLDLWREETVVYCAVHGLRPHYDSTNDLLNFQRNRIRHLLIPNLETYNPKLRETILRMSQSLKGDYTFVMETLENCLAGNGADRRMRIRSPLTLNCSRTCSLGLQRNLVKHAMQTLRPGVDITFSIGTRHQY
jgi:tRNA(Ile)-lysidine synthase